MNESLAVKYRPKDFSSVVEQNISVQILNKVIETGQFKNAYLFCGPSGVGKTSIARLFANAINKGAGAPIEIDAASNNSVDQVREIIASSTTRDLFAEYKIYIIDECHAITTQGWQAFLKGLEEPPAYTIYIFCTTEPNKIPATVQNRLQRFNLSKISDQGIEERLKYICANEGFTNYDQACNFISKLAHGGMRDAICYLEQCSDYSKDLSIENVKAVLGDISYELDAKFTNYLLDKNKTAVLAILEQLFADGRDLKNFIDIYLDFILDLIKYKLFNSIELTGIPKYLSEINDDKINVNKLISRNNINYYLDKIVETLIELKSNLRYEAAFKAIIEAYFIKIINELGD